MNRWHDIPLTAEFPTEFPVVIEVPQHSHVKYELDKNTGLIHVDRILYSAVHYPLNYGFIPRTYCDDGDPMDVMLLGNYALVPGALISGKAVAYMHMLDDGETDAKIIAAPTSDPEWHHVTDLPQLNPHLILKIKEFFTTYKNLQNKKVSDLAIHPAAHAKSMLIASHNHYKERFPSP